ncbi:MAG: alpha/beta fold hydrolase [Anaerolineales bacterium]|jgi:long-chain acyl-CoA synthetase
MDIDLELYRREARVSYNPAVNVSVIDIAPDVPLGTMVFLHGFGGDARQWRYQLREFSVKNRVVALDLRGHGQSDRPAAGYSMDRLLDDVIAALDVLGIAGKFVLIGHSFGGAIAAEFAVQYPERISQLILIATAGEFHLNPLYRTAMKLPTQVLRQLNRPTRNWLQAPPEILRRMYYDTLRDWRGWKLFEQISVPTLVIRGHRDTVFEKEHFVGVTQTIPNADEVNVGYSGHMVMIERRDAVNREIERFISSAPRTWRYEPTDLPQQTLFANRPWLYQYERDVPYTIAVPPVSLVDLLHSAARRFPSRTALEAQGQTMTYQQLLGEIKQFASALQKFGVEKGERVFIMLPNLPALVVAFFGSLKAGAVVVFTTPDAKPVDMLTQIEQTQSGFVITLSENTELIQVLDGMTTVRQLILVDRSLPGALRKRLSNSGSRAGNPELQEKLLSTGKHLPYRDLLRAFAAAPQPVEINPRETAVIVYTGGTTSTPKGVMLSHRNLVANAIQVRHWMPDAQEGQEIFLAVVPLTHSYGLTAALNVPISLGATLILKTHFDLYDVLQTIKRLRPTIFPGVPGMYMAINNTPGVRGYGIASIKYCLSGSAPLPVEVQEAFERLTKGRLVEGYGLTEASPVTHVNPLQGGQHPGSIGVPLPSTEAQIVDLAKGQKVVPVGQIGELAVRGPQVMLGYWQDPESTHAVLTRDGWLLTGDVAQMDPSGFFHLIARKVDMWYPRKQGEPAFPRDVEEVIYEIPQVSEVVVVAIAGQPVAFVKADRERPESEAVISYCKRRLPPELVPRLVIFVDDFPRTFIGKVLRRELANQYSQADI